MTARFSFDLVIQADRLLLEQFQQLRLAHCELVEIRAHTRETIAQSHDLMCAADILLARR